MANYLRLFHDCLWKGFCYWVSCLRSLFCLVWNEIQLPLLRRLSISTAAIFLFIILPHCPDLACVAQNSFHYTLLCPLPVLTYLPLPYCGYDNFPRFLNPLPNSCLPIALSSTIPARYANSLTCHAWRPSIRIYQICFRVNYRLFRFI